MMRLFALLLFLPFALAQSFYVESFESDKKFFVNKQFRVRYVPQAQANVLANVTWTYPTNCSYITDSPNNQTVLFTCTQEQTVTIGASAINSPAASFSLNILKISTCYNWYFITAPDLSKATIDPTKVNHVASGETYEARIWVWDPLQASSDERAKVASLPSTSSARFSRGYQSAGDIPVVTFTHNAPRVTQNVTFNDTLNIWTFKYRPVKNGYSTFKITDQSVSVFGCSIEGYHGYVSISDTIVKGFTTDTTPVTLTSGNLTSRDLIVQKDTCVPSTMYITAPYLGDGRILYSDSGVSTLSVKSIPIKNERVIGMTTAEGIGAVYLTATSVYYSLDPLMKSTFSPAAPAKLTDIKNSGTCFLLQLQKDDLTDSLVTVWDKAASEYFVSFDAGKTFKRFQTSSPVIDVAYYQPLREFLVLLNSTVSRYEIPYKKEVADAYELKKIEDVPLDLDTTAYRMDASENEILLYGQTVLISPNSGKSFFKVTMMTGTIKATLAANELIMSATFNVDNGYLLQTSANRLFYGMSGIDKVYEIPSGVSMDTDMYASFDDDMVQVIYKDAANTATGISSLSFLPSVFLAHTKSCIYSTWSTVVLANRTVEAIDEFVLDRNENITLVETLDAEDAVKFSVTYSNSAITSVNTTKAESSLALAVASNKQVGRNDISVQIQGGIECEEGIVQTFTAWTGCPLTRHIRYQYLPRKVSSGGGGHGSTKETSYTSTGHSYDFSKKNTSLVNGRFTCSDCVDEVYYVQIFRPILELWDGDTFVEEVPSDFIVIEKIGRTDFRFMDKEGEKCTAALSNYDKWKTLTKDNYTKCESVSGKSFKSDRDYPILSVSNGNGISWESGHDDSYTFTARVLDPNYSFCYLETDFKLKVYGAPFSGGIQAAIVLGLTALLFVILLGSYFSFAHKTLKEREEQQQHLKKD